MNYVKLGGTGLEVSQLVLGCMSYGDPQRGSHEWTLNEAESRPFIKKALDIGINFFDTANVYSDGTSEEIVGRALNEMVKRDEVVIAHKSLWTHAARAERRGIVAQGDSQRNRP